MRYGTNDLRGTFKVNDYGVCPVATAYADWSSMLIRSFSEEYKAKRTCYAKVTCCEEWRLFSNFLEWFNTNGQPFDQIKNLDLDKDLLSLWGNTYSPSTCIYVPKELNSILVMTTNSKDCLLGVYFDKESGKYRTQGKTTPYGVKIKSDRFTSELEAHHSYLVYKAGILMWASESFDEIYQQPLITAAEHLLSIVDSNGYFDFRN